MHLVTQVADRQQVARFIVGMVVVEVMNLLIFRRLEATEPALIAVALEHHLAERYKSPVREMGMVIVLAPEFPFYARYRLTPRSAYQDRAGCG